MSINPFYYKNIILQNDGINVSDLSNSGDFALLKEFDLNNTGKEPPNKNTFDVSSISFDINTSYKNTFNLNSRDISNINTINIPGIFLNKLKFDFNKNVTFNNLRIFDKYLEPIPFLLIHKYNVENNSTFDISNNVTNDYIINNQLIVDFSKNIPMPYNFKYERKLDNNIFKIGSLNIQNNILQEKNDNNFNWNLAPWKIITISNETIPDQDLSVNKLNDYLKNIVNQQGRKIFPSDKHPIEIYPYNNSDISCVINFRYQGYTESELNDNTDLSFVDISTAYISINNTSYKYNLAKNIYIDISSNLFEYLNLNNTNDVRLSNNTENNDYNETAIKLPINQDISINFIFKQSKVLETLLYYGTSLNNDDFVYLTSYNNFSDKIPFSDHDNNVINYDPNNMDLSGSYTISPQRVDILNIDNKNIIYDEGNNINMYYDYVNCNKLDICDNITNSNNLLLDSIDISFIKVDLVSINKIENANYLFTSSQNIYSYISNHNLIDCSLGIFSSNLTDISNTNANDINILNNLQLDISSSINNIVDNSYAYIISYNNKNIINYDNCANVLNFGISSESIYNNVNIDIKKTLHLKDGGLNPSAADTSYNIVNPYSANITNTIVNNIYVTSDDRIKFDEKDISNGIEIINSLNPKIYIKNNLLESGYIAQEVSSISDISYIVSKFNNTNYINYNAIQPYIVNAIQVLHKKLLQQNSIINELTNELIPYLSEPEPEPEPDPQPEIS
tara:strand:+ start:165 stop:2369 length:2205 start_codon:yes stop_codon:yes gene_type:complete